MKKFVEDRKLPGLAFSSAAMGPRYEEGVFVGQMESQVADRLRGVPRWPRALVIAEDPSNTMRRATRVR